MQRLLLATLSLLLLNPVTNATTGFHSNQAIQLGFYEHDLPEMGRVQSAVLTAEGRTWSFRPPVHWTVQSTDGGMVWLQAQDGSRISFRLTQGRGDVPADQLRVVALTRLPEEARIVHHTTCHTESESGPAFDFTAAVPGGSRIDGRLAYVRVGDRWFEFHLLTSPELFRQHLVTFSVLLGSFQAHPSAPATGGGD